MFELPSGKVDSSDHSVLSALIRELLEESRLNVTSVVGELNPFTYLTQKTVKGQYGTQIASKDCIQLNYVVNVDGGKVVVNPNEHSEFIWAPLDVERLDITEGMKGVIRNAFSWAGEKYENAEGMIHYLGSQLLFHL